MKSRLVGWFRAIGRLVLTGVALSSIWQCGAGAASGTSSTSGASTTQTLPGRDAEAAAEGGTATSSGGTSPPISGGEGGGASLDDAGGSQAVATGGSDSGASSTSSSVAAGSSGSSAASSSGATDGDAGPLSATARFSAARIVLTGVRAVATPIAAQSVSLHNGGTSPLQLASLAIGGANQGLFQIGGAPTMPATLMPGADLPLTVALLTGSANMPAAPPQDSGSTLLTATLTATTNAGAVRVDLYGLVLTTAIWEPTLGQILTTLGYKLNAGAAQNNANPNRGRTAQQLPGVEPGTDEVAAPLFVRAGAGNVTLTAVARFSPKGVLPFGWYPSGQSTMRNAVGTMAEITDAQTSNKARLVGPPLVGGSATSFDPGTGPFGVWVYTDEATQKYDTGNAANGDYDYSQDSLNSPTNVHRFKAYPLKDSTGTPIANNYLLAVEEATNGDYQDYVFVLGNVGIAP